MWALLAKMGAGVLLACVAAGAIISMLHGSNPNWALILVVAAFAASVFSIRMFALLRREQRRLHARDVASVEAINELVGSMARLSMADLSIFITADHRRYIDEAIVFSTSRGSPNHDVLVQMADLGLVRPHAMRRLGQSEYHSAQYALTPDGVEYLGKVLGGVAKRRAFLARGPAAA